MIVGEAHDLNESPVKASEANANAQCVCRVSIAQLSGNVLGQTLSEFRHLTVFPKYYGDLN